jgi:hypothetical protein
MRKALLLLALGWGVLFVLIVFGYYIDDADWATALIVLAGGALLLVPVALPLRLLRSRWYRIATFCCALVAALLDVALVLAGAFYLLPSAALVLLAVLPPQPR